MQDRQTRHHWFKTTILPFEAVLRKRLARMAIPSGIEIDDIVAESLVRAYSTENFAQIDHGRNFLFTIARNWLVDLTRRSAVVPFDLMANLDSLELIDPSPTPESAALAREELERLQTVVDSLPEQCRRVFILRRLEDLSPEAIAVQLQLSVSTVEKHLSKAMSRLTQGMADGDSMELKSMEVKKGAPWQRTNTNR